MKRFCISLFIVLKFVVTAITPSIIFKENKGQWPEKVLFGTEILNTKFYVNKNSFNYCIYNNEELLRSLANVRTHKMSEIVRGHNYEVNFIGGDFSQFTKKEIQSEYYNYFLGKDKSKWASNVKAFGNIGFKEVYRGIDLELYSNKLNLKYDLIVKPKADPGQIKLNYNYIDGIKIKNEELVIKTSVGEIIEKAPVAWQFINGKKEFVKCKYSLIEENTIGFVFPEGYNRNYELIIDPVVVVCSYSGASNYAIGQVCTYDSAGNIYNLGCSTAGYPTTVGAFQTTGNLSGIGVYDFILSVYNSTGTSKLFSTFLGGVSNDFPLDILVKNNEIVMFGGSDSKDFPCTPNGFDTSLNSPSSPFFYDIVISKFNIQGTSLMASTFVGGLASESINYLTNNNFGGNIGEMEVDDIGNVFIIGATNSANFPITSGAISSTLKGQSDAVVLKMDNTLSNLIWSTYLGGNSNESGLSIKLDDTGGVYCYGSTNSLNFPTTSGVISPVKNGGGPLIDNYIAHINSTGTALIASTYLGTPAQDYAGLMNIDRNNNIYVCGNMSNSGQLIPSPGIYSNPNGYNFIYKVNSALTNIIYKTKFGNYSNSVSPYLFFTAFKIDSCQKVYISGFAANTLPTTPNQFQPYGGGPTDIYMAVFNSNCSSLSFASFYGGSQTVYFSTIPSNNPGESASLADFDNKGRLYHSVCISGGLPTTSNAYAPTFVSTSTFSPTNDAFLKVDFQTFVNASSSYGANVIGCQPFTSNFISATNTGTVSWNFGDGSPISNLNNDTHTYQDLGNYNVALVVSDTATCNKTDSVKTLLSVVKPLTVDFGPDKFICMHQQLQIQSPVNAVTYLWDTGETTSSITISQPGTHTLVVNNGGCDSYDDVNVIIGEDALNSIFPNIVTPNGDGVNDYIDLGICNFSELDFTVFDRWGKPIYQSTSASDQWNPSGYSDGTCFYVISYKSDCTGEYKKNKGYITILK